MQNIVKCGKYSPVKFAKFVYLCITHGKALQICGNVVTQIPRNTKVYKIRKLYITIFSTFYNILQPNFAILLNFRKLFPTVLKLFSNLEVSLTGEWSIAKQNFYKEAHVVLLIIFSGKKTKTD